MLLGLGEVAEWSKAAAGNGRYTARAVSEVRILPLSATAPKTLVTDSLGLAAPSDRTQGEFRRCIVAALDDDRRGLHAFDDFPWEVLLASGT